MGKHLEKCIYNLFYNLKLKHILFNFLTHHKFLLFITNLDSDIICTSNSSFSDLTKTSTILNAMPFTKTLIL